MNINFAEISDIKERRKAFLFDTANFYNSKNRAVISHGYCSYAPTGNSPGCAIGRHLDRDSILLQDGKNYPVYYYENSLPFWMKEMGMAFLTRVQCFHDTEVCWNEMGLTLEGKKYLRITLQAYCQ